MKTIEWKREPRGPGPNAFHMFLDAEGERVVLAYDEGAMEAARSLAAQPKETWIKNPCS